MCVKLRIFLVTTKKRCLNSIPFFSSFDFVVRVLGCRWSVFMRIAPCDGGLWKRASVVQNFFWGAFFPCNMRRHEVVTVVFAGKWRII